MTNLKILFLLSILSFTLYESLQSDWITIASEEGGYSIDFPLLPTESKQSTTAEGTEIIMNIQMLDISSKDEANLAYGVSFTDFPEKLISELKSEEDIQTFLNGSRDGAVENLKGTLVSSSLIEIEGGKGITFDILILNGSATVRMNYYLIKNRTYTTQVISKTSLKDNKDSGRFLKSFTLF